MKLLLFLYKLMYVLTAFLTSSWRFLCLNCLVYKNFTVFGSRDSPGVAPRGGHGWTLDMDPEKRMCSPIIWSGLIGSACWFWISIGRISSCNWEAMGMDMDIHADVATVSPDRCLLHVEWVSGVSEVPRLQWGFQSWIWSLDFKALRLVYYVLYVAS